MSPGRQIGTSLGWSNRIFSGRPGEAGGGRPRDVLATNISGWALVGINLDQIIRLREVPKKDI